MLFVGIDISKLTFDASYLFNNSYVDGKFENNNKGFVKLLTMLEKHNKETIICLEATGIYSFSLAKFLVQKSIKVIVVNPIITHAFFKMEMNRNKTDKADAQLIARYCKHLVMKGDIDRKLYIPKDDDYESIQRLITRLEQLEKSKTQEINRLEASLDLYATRSIKRLIKCILSEIKRVKETLSNIVKNNENLNKQVQLLTSIKGIGDKTAWSILAYIGDISFFDNAKQVASYAGLTPKITQSGTSVNKCSLSKLGHKRLRKSLYMPALVAMRHNPLLKQFYERLVGNGKPKKVAIIAVMRKLLVLSYGVLKSEKPFDISYNLQHN